MAWSLKKHILGHSAAVHNTLGSKRLFNEYDTNRQHFTMSLDFSQLILNHSCFDQNSIDNKMNIFMNDLVQYQKTYREIKGKNKNNERIYREINFNFNDDILLAYHNDGSDNMNSNNYSVNPHFHFLAHKSLKLGIGYKYLRDAVDEISKKHGLIFNFQEETGKEKVDARKATALTWFVKRSSDENFIKKMNSGWIEKALVNFQEHYKKTENIQYLLKGYRDLEMRCKRLNVSHNLNFNLFLTEKQKDTIKTLYSGQKSKIDELVRDRSNYIARAFLEHSQGFSSIIIDEIEKRTLRKIPSTHLELKSIDIKQKEKGVSGDYSKTLNYCYEEDIKLALRYAKNEKELKDLMIKLGYKNFAFKQKNISGSRQRVGFTFNNKNTTVYFNNIKLTMQEIRNALVANFKNLNIDIPDVLYSHLQNYIPKEQLPKQNLIFEEIYSLKSSLKLYGFSIIETLNNVELKAKGTCIIDNGDSILVKAQQQEDMERNIILVVDIIESKGWMDGEYEITGTAKFKLAMAVELEKRATELKPQFMLDNEILNQHKAPYTQIL